LSVIIFGTIIILYNKLFYITFDEESAYLTGIPTKRINIFFSVLVALTVAISMRIVGVLLISSLMVLPVAASLLIAKSFKAGLVYSMVFGVVSVIIGLILSYYLNLATGGTIVLSALAILLIIIIFQNMKKAYV
jgi:zinc transport system permease protein